jgi:cell division protease FtsH
VGALSFYDSTGARGYNLVKPYSEKTAEAMDAEVKAIVKDVHDRTRKLIDENREGFMKLGALLLEKEVIFAEDIENILGPKVKPAEEDRFTESTEE